MRHFSGQPRESNTIIAVKDTVVLHDCFVEGFGQMQQLYFDGASTPPVKKQKKRFLAIFAVFETNNLPPPTASKLTR